MSHEPTNTSVPPSGNPDPTKDAADLVAVDGVPSTTAGSGVLASAPYDPNSGTTVSRVLHLRHTPGAEIPRQDIVNFLSAFGSISYIMHSPKHNITLIEMTSVESAVAAVNYCRQNSPQIANIPLRFSYSKSQYINRNLNDTSRPERDHAGERIILITIQNPLYNITTDTLHSVLSPYGNVQRIVIFTKNGVQALVEFDAPDAAVRAKAALDGKNIYDNCCTMKIDYSKVTEKLNVKFNNDKTRDFQNPNLPPGNAPSSVLSPGNGHYPQHPSMQGSTNYAGGYGTDAFPGYPSAMEPYPGSNYGMPPGMANQSSGPMGGERCVIIVYGVESSPIQDCDNLFNLFCLYGNINRIKLLRGKKAALVQFSDQGAAETALRHVNHLQLFGTTLTISFSKHNYIAGRFSSPSQDGSEVNAETGQVDAKDYSQSPHNRFHRPARTNSKHIYKPCATLYFSNAPPNVDEAGITSIFVSAGGSPLTAIKFFESQAQTRPGQAPKRLGLVEFADGSKAAEALVLANNNFVSGCTLKLAFAQNTIGSRQEDADELPEQEAE